jgi:hypothetical protein
MHHDVDHRPWSSTIFLPKSTNAKVSPKTCCLWGELRKLAMKTNVNSLMKKRVKTWTLIVLLMAALGGSLWVLSQPQASEPQPKTYSVLP